MPCDDQTSRGGGDSLEVNAISRPFENSATAWLVGQGVRYLNTADKEGELAYLRVVELLRGCGKDLLETVIGLFRQAKSGDAPLRWNLLYVLGDAGNEGAADFLVRIALERLPEANPDGGCEELETRRCSCPRWRFMRYIEFPNVIPKFRRRF